MPQKAEVTVYTGTLPYTVTGNLYRQWPSGAVTIETEQGTRFTADAARSRILTPGEAPTKTENDDMKKTTVPTEVLAALSAATFSGNEMRLGGTLDRASYQKVAKIVEAVGGKWNRGAAAHIFDGDAYTAIEPVLLTGEIVRPADMGQFDSPPSVVAKVIEAAGISDGMDVLEPSAGVGNIAVAAADAGGKVRVCEIDAKRVEKLRGLGLSTRAGDFLTMNPDAIKMRFDRVVMNPPFAKQADIDHVKHALRFLKPGGRLVAVMAAGVRFRQDAKARQFREALGANPSFRMEDLPAGSFRASGTDVNTVLVSVDV